MTPLPELSPVGPAAMERAAKDAFLAALGGYRHAVRHAHDDGSAGAHEMLHSAYANLSRARARAGKLFTGAPLQALEASAATAAA